MIPMLDLGKEFLEIEQEVVTEVIKVLKSSRYILGPHVEDLEKRLALYHGVNYAIGLGSGTGALFLSLMSLSISKGDEVITTPFTFFATIESILYNGAKPSFVDIDETTLNMDVTQIERTITSKTKALLPVHLFGLPCDMGAIMDISKRFGLSVVEDCAQSFGSSIDGKLTGTFGDSGCFSFYPSKNLGCYGDGGSVVTNRKDVYEQILALRNHGSRGDYIHNRVGFNSRLDEIQAAIVLVKLKRVEAQNELRRKNAAIYNELLKDYVVCPATPKGYVGNYHQYTIRSPRRDKIRKALESKGISSVVYYSVPMHLQKALTMLGYKKGDFPVAEKASSEVLSLPVYPGMSEDDVHRVCDVIIAQCR